MKTTTFHPTPVVPDRPLKSFQCWIREVKMSRDVSLQTLEKLQKMKFVFKYKRRGRMTEVVNENSISAEYKDVVEEDPTTVDNFVDSDESNNSSDEFEEESNDESIVNDESDD